MELSVAVLMMSGAFNGGFSVAQKHISDNLVDAYRLFFSGSELSSYHKWFVGRFHERQCFRQ